VGTWEVGTGSSDVCETGSAVGASNSAVTVMMVDSVRSCGNCWRHSTRRGPDNIVASKIGLCV
jgi:hypothetical protein